jgi:hypothetical protein
MNWPHSEMGCNVRRERQKFRAAAFQLMDFYRTGAVNLRVGKALIDGPEVRGRQRRWLVVEPCVHLGCQHGRSLPLCLEPARLPALENQVHQYARLGLQVTSTGSGIRQTENQDG